MIAIPHQLDLDEASQTFDQDWGAVDEVLYRLCREHPDHKDRRWSTAKVALIGRAYSAGLERRVTPPKGQQALVSGRHADDRCGSWAFHAATCRRDHRRQVTTLLRVEVPPLP